VQERSFHRIFSLQLTWRILVIISLVVGCTMVAVQEKIQYWQLLILLSALSGVTYSLYRYVNDTNRRLTRFFESIRYSDFAVRFSVEEEKGAGFGELSRQLNDVLEAFRQTRAEKEANLLFMNAIVQHLSAGILAFDMYNNLIISNNSAFQLLGVYRVNNILDLPENHQTLVEFVGSLKGKGKMLYQPEPGRQISVQGVALNLQGRNVRLLTLQNIHVELQRKELDAWQNLTRVLRHEIMNSVTPIVTLIETMKDIVKTDLPPDSATADLEEALDIVGSRSRSLMDFVEAYRSYSAIPEPKPEKILVSKMIERVSTLAAADMKQAGIRFDITPADPKLFLMADPGQIEMVLINLLKNAREALGEMREPVQKTIQLRAENDSRGVIHLLVTDNGPGIAEDLLEEIFIPFYTAKVTGTGVGLSISKQIMQLHGGDIRVVSAPGKGATFELRFG
jgi:two-component system, NtrC family, nitrogen regulation sensor histidine kinase NtrY